MGLKKIETVFEALAREAEEADTDISVEALPDDIKGILDKNYSKKKDAIQVKQHKELDQNQVGYNITFPEGNCTELSKNQIQELINHPNFKSANLTLIEFKYDYDLKKE